MIMNSQEESRDTPEALLAYLRQNCKKIKSYDEIVNLLHVIASEQKTRSLIRSCMDKVLINMSDIHSLREMIDRLRSVARTNGLRFQVPLDEAVGSNTTCMITGDMFKVEISLNGQDIHFCNDVKVYYSDHPRSCPELLEIIRDGKFLKLSEYLKSLIDMYPINMDRQTKTRVYMALQSLEIDISKMGQIYKESHQDCDNLQLVNHGSVGILAPHAVGKNLQLNYFLSPYDLIDPVTKQLVTIFENMPETKGLHAEIKVVSQDSLRALPISPLISNNHPIDGTGKPRFAEVNQHNSISLPACFVMKLKPAIVLTSKIATEIQTETGISVFQNGTLLQSYVSLIVKEGLCSEVTFGEHTHRYHLGFNHLKAALVEEIHFTHPGHIAATLTLLRKQAYFNAIITSCVRPKKENHSTEATEWYFDVSTDNLLTKLNITFEHPLCSNSTAFAEILFSADGYSACHLFTGRGDPPLCTDQYATKVLQKSYSLPITMRNLMKQTKQQPRKEPDRNRLPPLRNSMLHPAASGGYKKQAPVPPKPPQPAPTHNSQFSSLPKPAITTQTSSAQESPRQEAGKETNHPMLANLLKPSHEQSVAPKPSSTAVQTKKHPMLLNLLNDSDKTSSNTASSKTTTTSQPVYSQSQSFQQPTPDQYNNISNVPHSIQSYFNPQPTGVNPMPPPPSYPNSIPMKPVQQPYQMQQLYQSPLNLDDLSTPTPMTPSLTSPSFNTQPNMGHSMTPPLMPVHNIPQSPNTSSIPSPMYSTQSSPMQPSMNTPQPLPMASPMHPAMTPPLASPRKVGRRGSRQKSHSMEVANPNSMDIKSELSEFNFDETDFFNPGTSPAPGNAYMNTKLVSPNLMRGEMPSFGNSFSFDSDFGTDTDRTLGRKNSLGRRPSGQAFTPQPSMGQDNQDFGIKSEFIQHQEMQQFRPIFPNYPQQQMTQQQHGGSMDMQDEHSISIKTPTSVTRSISQSSEQPEADPFKFDDNRAPSKISMSDSSGNLQRSGSLSRQSSSSSLMDDSTLKGLLVSPISGGNGNKSAMMKGEKGGTVLHNLLSKNLSNIGQRRASEESLAGSSQQSMGGHKPLVRQNAVSKPGMVKSAASLPAKAADGKEKARKRAAGKDDAAKGPPKRRGRPPSTDKKEHTAVKRKKMDDDSESPRGKIVLNVQLNKGMPISSTTKTKPNQPQTPNTIEKPAASVPPPPPPPAPTGAPATLAEIGKYSPDMQRYFKTQVEMKMKKKERKLGSGSASPVTAGTSKANGKFPTPQSAKSGTNGAKVPAPAPQKTQVSPQQKPAAPKLKRNSINDVVEMLQDVAVQKMNEKPATSTAENPGLPKLKPIGVPPARMAVGKSPAAKPTSILKQGSSKSPSHSSSKPMAGPGRVQQNVKKDQKPRPVTPQRDEKGAFVSPPLAKTSPKTQMQTTLLSQDPKMKTTLNRITESAAAAAAKIGNLPSTSPNAGVAKQRMAGIGRLNSGSKSPGRSVTPPHAKVPFPTGIPEVHIQHDQRVHNLLLKGRKSPAHAVPNPDVSTKGGEASDDRSSAVRTSAAVSHPRKSTSSDSAMNAPPAKRQSISPALTTGQVTSSSVTVSPMSPTDQLVIDDESAPKLSRSVTPVQAAASSSAVRESSPVVKQPPATSEPTPPNFATLMKKGSSEIDFSPIVSGSPCVIDDALMDEAVS
uniref:Mediator of RNA polymerase II transcription subunit 1 n=1 Tax=Phallusia mammillata TaxID=59560 RepID=A0A6F9DJT2_9ASCI|nr:mediator of RNA polymerase II transcription subunit 1-like [Phallusia mammillata]